MTVWGVASAKGSPGATTSVLAIAAAWPSERQLLVLDADPAGGDIAAALGIEATPSIVTLAVEARSGLDETVLHRHAQVVPGPGNVSVIAGAATAEEAAVATELVARAGLGQQLRRLPDTDVLVDLGRLDVQSPIRPMVADLEQLLVVLRPTWSQVHHAMSRTAGWQSLTRVGLLILGERPYSPAEVGAVVGVPVVGVLADDASTAAALGGAGGSGRGLHRSRLWRSARPIAEELAGPIPVNMLARQGSEATC